MNLDRAIEVVAREVLHRMDASEWGDFPEIGEHDWDAVLCKVEDLTPAPALEEYMEAYAFLTARAGEQ